MKELSIKKITCLIFLVSFITIFHTQVFAQDIVEEARKGNLQKVKELIETGAYINSKDTYGVTPLYIASARGHKEVVKFLISQGADVTISNDHGFTPLMAISQKGWKRIVEILISNGADVNAKTNGGVTALMSASGGGNKEVVEFLISRGTDVNAISDNGFTPLLSAVKKGHKDVAELLISKGADANPDKPAHSPLLMAIFNGHKEVAALLISKGADVNYQQGAGETLLNVVLDKGSLEIAELLIDNGANVEYQIHGQNPPLIYYARQDKYKIVELLVSKGADIEGKDKNGKTALMYASANGNLSIVELLLSHGADVNAKTKLPLGYSSSNENATPIFYASKNGHKEIVKFLISKGADVNASENSGYTPLIYASTRGYKDIAELLISNGADVDAKDGHPLMFALEKGHLEIAQLLVNNGADINAKSTKKMIVYSLEKNHDDIFEFLISNGADVNVRGYRGSTPLIIAIERGRKDLVEELISKGADVNVRDWNGNTPLLIAIRKGNKEMVKHLIDNGVDVNAQDYSGKTPLMLASEMGAKEIKRLLASKGASQPPVSKIAFRRKGTIVDNETGLPLEDVVLVRSWDRVIATFEGPHYKLWAYEETTSDEKGEFGFSFKPLRNISVPILSEIEENKLIAFKPGYKFLVVDEKAPILKMEKIPATYYVRYEEAEKAQDNYEIKSYETKLFREIIKQEEEVIKRLPQFIPGVFFISKNASDIDIDEDGNIYIADNHYIHKVSKLGERLNIRKVNMLQIRSDYGPIDIEFDQHDNLYALKKNEFLRIHLTEKAKIEVTPDVKSYKKTNKKSGYAVVSKSYYSPTTTKLLPKKGQTSDFPRNMDMRFTFGANRKLFIIPYNYRLQATILSGYNFEGNKLCTYKLPGEKFVDITSDVKDDILTIHSFARSTFDMKTKRYAYRNGILKIDQNCNRIFYKEIGLDGKVRSITTTAGGKTIIADKYSFYIFDENLNLIFKETLKGKEFGEVDIKRIKADKQGEYLFLIDSKYGRILKYNIIKKEWYKKS